MRKPFEWQDALWTCVSKSGDTAQAYRLAAPQAFPGQPVTCRAKTIDREAVRGNPNGFYHGMTITHAGRSFVLSGPRRRSNQVLQKQSGQVNIQPDGCMSGRERRGA